VNIKEAATPTSVIPAITALFRRISTPPHGLAHLPSSDS
jgi:hypothetical protein